MPGTTRDTVERQVELGGIPLTIIDTAGLRKTQDPVELLGIARTRAAIERADLALMLCDARDDAGADAHRTADIEGYPSAGVLAGELPAALPRIVVHNKCDLAHLAPHVESASVVAHVWLCALTGEGLPLLEREVRRIAGVDDVLENAFLARGRQLAALADAANRLDAAATHARAQPAPIELFAEELRDAQRAFSAITGEFTADDLLGEIFSRFCIGK
jgi:tRNA modification GTPase